MSPLSSLWPASPPRLLGLGRLAFSQILRFCPMFQILPPLRTFCRTFSVALEAGTAEQERLAFTEKDTPEVAQLKLDLLRIAALTGR